MSDFSSIGMFSITGHSSYKCATTTYDDSGDLADLECSARRNGNDDSCLYRRDISTCLEREIISTNYAHWTQLAKSEDPLRLGQFDLLVLDEVHKAHDLLVDHISIKLHPRSIRLYLDMITPEIDDPVSIWLQWAYEARDRARDKYKSMQQSRASKRDLIILTKLGKDIVRFISGAESDDWIIDRSANGRSILLSPVWGTKYAEQYLFRDIPRVLLVSATANEETARQLGVPMGDLDSIEVDSAFPVERRPFIYVPTTRVDWKMSEGQKRLVMNKIDINLIPQRMDRKGIIHSRSYDYARDDIYRLTRHKDIIRIHDKEHAQQAIEDFRQCNPPALFCSPIVEEGHDFPDDLCRYQVIWKVPFIDKRSKLIQARVKSNKSYEVYKIVETIEQIYGRPMRSITDFAETFIFDTHWSYFHKKPECKWHKWFKRSWKKSYTVPMPIKFTTQY